MQRRTLMLALLGAFTLGAAAGAMGHEFSVGQRSTHDLTTSTTNARFDRLERSLSAIRVSVARTSACVQATATGVQPAPSKDAAATTRDPITNEAAPEPRLKQFDAGDALAKLVSDAIQRGQWTETTRQNFRELAAAADPERRAELSRELLIAANAQKLQIHVRGPLL